MNNATITIQFIDGTEETVINPISAVYGESATAFAFEWGGVSFMNHYIKSINIVNTDGEEE